nr:hypothetical protein [Lentilactobacillus otakiensis]
MKAGGKMSEASNKVKSVTKELTGEDYDSIAVWKKIISFHSLPTDKQTSASKHLAQHQCFEAIYYQKLTYLI